MRLASKAFIPLLSRKWLGEKLVLEKVTGFVKS